VYPVPSGADSTDKQWPFAVLELPLGKALALLEGAHTHLRDTAPVEEGAGKGLALHEWRSCSGGADILKADTEPGDIATAGTAEEGDTAKSRIVKEEDIGRRDPGQVEEDRKLAGTIKLSTTGRERISAESHIQDKQPDPLGCSKDDRDPGGLDHPDECRDRWDQTLLNKMR